MFVPMCIHLQCCHLDCISSVLLSFAENIGMFWTYWKCPHQGYPSTRCWSSTARGLRQLRLVLPDDSCWTWHLPSLSLMFLPCKMVIIKIKETICEETLCSAFCFLSLQVWIWILLKSYIYLGNSFNFLSLRNNIRRVKSIVPGTK